MTQPVFSGHDLPAHHEGMLVVKLRPSIARFAPNALGAVAAFDTPGMTAFAALERRGMVKRVTPLRTPTGETPPPGPAGLRVAAALGAMAPQVDERSANAGACMVELETGADIGTLQDSLAVDPDIEYAAPVPVRYAVAKKGRPSAKSENAAPAAVPPPATTMWNLDRIRWKQARALAGFKDADAVKVAVLDTGIQPDHPDLAGRVAEYVHDFPEVFAPSGPEDVIGHGTHVAGTIAANFANQFGVHGICTCELMAWKIFDDEPDYRPSSNGPGSYVYYVNPIMYRRSLAECLDEGVDVINLSIGGRGAPDPQEQALFETLLADGVTVVAAMGNERDLGSPISYPAAIPGVIAVGATNVNDRVANFSNRGPHISVSAPGVSIWSTLPTYPGQTGFDANTAPDGTPTQGAPHLRETDYDSWPGTSMASPHVAAAAALLLAKNGPMPGSAVRSDIMQAADRVPDMKGASIHQDFGAGRLNLYRLLK